MIKKLSIIGLALVATFALAMSAVTDHAVACDKSAKQASAKADKGCSSATTAQASTCGEKASAKTASSGCCAGKAAAAKTASAGECAGSAKTASASGCTRGAAAKTASAGCCEGKAAVAGYSKAGHAKCDTEGCPASACDDKFAQALSKVVDDIPQAERTRVVVAGTIECAHCTYDAVGTCQPLLKTADGKVYPMLQSNIVKDMRHSGAKQVEVTSNVRNAHGVKYLDVKTFKAL